MCERPHFIAANSVRDSDEIDNRRSSGVRCLWLIARSIHSDDPGLVFERARSDQGVLLGEARRGPTGTERKNFCPF